MQLKQSCEMVSLHYHKHRLFPMVTWVIYFCDMFREVSVN